MRDVKQHFLIKYFYVDICTEFIQQNTWKADSRSTSQAIPRLLWNQKVQFCDTNSWPVVPNMSQNNSDENLGSHGDKYEDGCVLGCCTV
jgi:hypothetical protein